MSEIIKSDGAWLCFVPPGGKETVLTSQEAQILQGIKSPRRRRDWLAGRWAAKELIQKYLYEEVGQEVALSHIEILNDKNGAPYARVPSISCPEQTPQPLELELSLAHSAGHGLAGFSRHGPIGVDLQRLRPVRSNLAERLLTEYERSQLALYLPGPEEILLFWALKEAAIKAQRTPPALTIRKIEVILTKPYEASVCIKGQQLSAWWGRRGDFVWACVTR